MRPSFIFIAIIVVIVLTIVGFYDWEILVGAGIIAMVGAVLYLVGSKLGDWLFDADERYKNKRK